MSMKYLKEHKNFDFNEDDFDFEEEYLTKEYFKKTIIRIRSFDNYNEILNLLNNLNITFGTSKYEYLRYYNDYPNDFAISIDDYYMMGYTEISFYKREQEYNDYTFLNDTDILNNHITENVDFDWNEDDFDFEEENEIDYPIDLGKREEWTKSLKHINIGDTYKCSFEKDPGFSYDNIKGTIISKNNNTNLTIEFNTNVKGHDGGGTIRGKDGHCWNFSIYGTYDLIIKEKI